MLSVALLLHSPSIIGEPLLLQSHTPNGWGQSLESEGTHGSFPVAL